MRIKPQHPWIPLILGLAALALAACGTTAKTTDVAALQQAHRIYAPLDWPRAEDAHIGEVFEVLRKHGYVLTDHPNEGDLALKFRITGSATLRATIELWRQHERVLQVEAVNHGAGTWMARPAARTGRVEAAVAELDLQLSQALGTSGSAQPEGVPPPSGVDRNTR